MQGIWVSKLLSLFGDTEARILVLGLDNAGKTTILCELWALGGRRQRGEGGSGGGGGWRRVAAARV